MTVLALLTAALIATPSAIPSDTVSDTVPAPTLAMDPRLAPATAIDTTRPRRRSVEVSEWYARRLTIHRIGSYTMLPLFAAQFALGQRMLNQKEDAAAGRGAGVSDGVLTAHRVAAGGVAALFGINTVTGLWNLYDSRQQPIGRTRRTVHALLMLASDAGFTATGLLASNARDKGIDDAKAHRNVALISMVPATIGATMMWLRHE